MQVNLLKTVVEQLVDENRPEAQNRVLLEEQYSPSLVVGHPVDGGAPVVFEPHPTFDNLFGRIEYGTDQARFIPATASCAPAPCIAPMAAFSCWRPRSCSASPSSGRRSSAPCNRAS